MGGNVTWVARSLVSHFCPLLGTGGLSALVTTCSWPIVLLCSGLSTTLLTSLSLGAVNLIAQLTEHKETCYLPDYQFISKGYNSNCQMKEMHKRRCALWVWDSHRTSMCSLTWKFSETCPLGQLWRCYHAGKTD